MLNRRQFTLLTAALGAGAGACDRAAAQPADKPVRIIVPLPAGGSTDALARLLADKLRNHYANTFVVDNRVGAGGRIAVEAARQGDADGSCILFTPDFPLTIFPSLYKNLPYQISDFKPVASCAVTSMALAVGPGLPQSVHTLQEFVQWAKANPNKANYASPAAGSPQHFAGMMFARMANVSLTHIAYKGGAPAIQDLLGGQVPLSINPVGEVMQYVESGRLRVLATTGPTRSRFLPDAPTLVEAGYGDVVVQAWQGVFMPAAAPASAVERLHDALRDVIKDTEVVQALARIGFEPTSDMSSSQFAELVRKDIERWASIVKTTGFTPDES